MDTTNLKRNAVDVSTSNISVINKGVMNFLNEAAFAYCSVRKKNAINLEESRLASVSHIYSLAPTLIDDQYPLSS